MEIASIALYRPGPMDSIPKISKTEHIRKKITSDGRSGPRTPDQTYGLKLPVYQEQVMQIFRTVAGYSLGKADIVRRAISKKKSLGA